jgi:hypothetical protein
MEVKVPKEIRDYQESIYFGLSARQFFFSIIAIIVAVAVYFSLSSSLGTETVSWLCILCAAPFAAMGFFRYNGMPFERFIFIWFRSQFLMPNRLVFRAENIYETAIISNRLKGKKHHEK